MDPATVAVDMFINIFLLLQKCCCCCCGGGGGGGHIQGAKFGVSIVLPCMPQ
jgi:hypothetical protein